MKPVMLTISGWGPYKNKVEIDFGSFQGKGLFLITGPTGAGKTTVFDALSYALYGEVSGNMRGKDSVRSDFADMDTKTYVELTMTHEEKEYRIFRSPQYLRPRKRKGGSSAVTREAEKAILVLPDGSSAEGSREVNRRLSELLRLDYEEFRQISMIAQGEFTKLLTAKASEKKDIFRNIFGTHLYKRFEEILRQRAAKLYGDFMMYRHKMDETILSLKLDTEEWKALSGNAPYQYGSVIQYLKQELKKEHAALNDYKASLERAERKAEDLTKQIADAENLNSRFKELEEAMQNQRLLEMQRAAMNMLRQEVQAIRNAEKLEKYYSILLNAVDKRKDMEIKCKEFEEISGRLQTAIKEGEGFYGSRDVLRGVILDYKEYVAFCLEYELMEKERKGKESELLGLQNQYIIQEEAAGEQNLLYEEAEREYKRAIIGIVAKQVKEGEPCPVCGSTKHPRVAEVSAGTPGEKLLNELKKKADEGRKRQLELHGKTASAMAQAELRRIQSERQYEKILGKKETISDISDTIKVLLEKLFCVQPERLEGLSYKKQQSEIDLAEKKLEDGITQMRQMLARLEARKGQSESMHKELIQCRDEEQTAEGIYLEKLKEYHFASEDQFLALRKKICRIDEKEGIVTIYDRQSVSNGDHLKRLRAVLEGKHRIELSGLIQSRAETLDLKREYRENCERLQILCSRLRDAVSLLGKRIAELSAIEAEYGIVGELDNLTRGNNSKKMPFEAFILANYFDRLLQASNLRLYKMTAGRYEMSRLPSDEADGRTKDNFEIQVLDYYTGKYRSSKTLSGGEAFKASLSLSLGMSDLVQADSGGIRVETLFIDEGFGSLDAQSLEQACEVLTSLVGKNRLIGIISHVPELKEGIECQLIVEKTNSGSHVSIQV